MTFSARIALDVDATRTRQGIVTVRSVLSFPATDRVALRVAKWLPAFHAPRGPLKFLAGLTFQAAGKSLPWTRDPCDPFRFLVEARSPISVLTCSHQFVGPTEHGQGRILMGESMLRLQWAGLCLYPEGVDQREIGVEATVRYPEGWHAASALAVERRDDARVHYSSCCLADFIDSPVLAGAHRRQAPLADGAVLEIFADEPWQLPAMQAHIDCHANLVSEADALFGRRPFTVYTFLLALSGQLGRMGLEHRASSENGVAPNYFIDWDHSVTERDLLPHEYVHSWIGKYRVPSGNLTRDFSATMTNELLWVYEGLTQYYGHILAARCGLVPVEHTLGAFALIAATYGERPGRRWRPLADTVHDPIIAGREPLPWKSWQRSEDYYSEGLLLWLEVDMTIRELSGNARSLDDFGTWFFSPSCSTELANPYDRSDLVAGLNGIQQFDWEDFLAIRIDQIASDPLVAGLQMAGYRLSWSDQPSEWHRCDQKHHSYCDLTFSVGLKVGLSQKVIEVIWDSPAFDAGLFVGTVLLKVDGEGYSHNVFLAKVGAHVDGPDPIMLTVRQHGVEREVALEWQKGHRFPVLEQVARRPLLLDVLQSRRVS